MFIKVHIWMADGSWKRRWTAAWRGISRHSCSDTDRSLDAFFLSRMTYRGVCQLAQRGVIDLRDLLSGPTSARGTSCDSLGQGIGDSVGDCSACRTLNSPVRPYEGPGERPGDGDRHFVGEGGGEKRKGKRRREEEKAMGKCQVKQSRMTLWGKHLRLLVPLGSGPTLTAAALKVK